MWRKPFGSGGKRVTIGPRTRPEARSASTMSVRKLAGLADSAIRGVYRSPGPLATPRKEGILGPDGGPPRRVEPPPLARGGRAGGVRVADRLAGRARRVRAPGRPHQLGAAHRVEGGGGRGDVRRVRAGRRRRRGPVRAAGPLGPFARPCLGSPAMPGAAPL